MLMEYRVASVLGVGGFGITYLARDTQLERDVAIKEYFPGSQVSRAGDGNVTLANPQAASDYSTGLDRFLKEARTLAGFSHPHIVRVNRYFKANGTGYMVMDYEDGVSLKTFLQRTPTPPEETLKELLAPLLDGIEKVHSAGFLHRDIKPDNIYVRRNGEPVLIDFGSARQALASQTHALTTLVTPGYAPFEQYSEGAAQGPFTDLYALGAVLFNAITGKNPPDAISRMKADKLDELLAPAAGRYSPGLLDAIRWAMRPDEKSRPQSVREWRARIFPASETFTLVTGPVKSDLNLDAPRTQPPPPVQASFTAPPATMPVTAPPVTGPRTGSPFEESIETQNITQLLEQREQLDKAVREKFQRVLTVMFTDLKGSTAIAEAHGDLAVRSMLKRYHDLVEASVQSNSGTLVKTIGDGCLCYFESALAACHAAIAIQKGMEELNLSKRYQSLLLCRIGMHTGECIIEKRDIFGDVVNTASRFESSAHPGEILMSEETYNALTDRSEFYTRFDREVTLKGKSQPFKAYIVFWDPKEIERDQAKPVLASEPAKRPTAAWKLALMVGVPIVAVLGIAFYITMGDKFSGETRRSINISVPVNNSK